MSWVIARTPLRFPRSTRASLAAVALGSGAATLGAAAALSTIWHGRGLLDPLPVLGAALAVAGGALAWHAGQRLRAAIAAVQRAACALVGHGEPPSGPVGMREGDRTIAALAQAAALLEERRRQRDEAELARGRDLARIRSVADAAPALVAYVDADHRYRFANRRHEEWFGRAAATWTGSHVREALGPAAYEIVRPHLEEALSGRVVEYEATLPWGAGVREVQMSCVPDVGATGQVRGVIVVARDVGARNAAERERAELLERALAASGAAQTSVERLRRLQALTDVALARPDVEALPREILAGIRTALEADSAALLVPEGPAGLVPVAVDGVSIGDVPMPSGETLARAVAERRTPAKLDPFRGHPAIPEGAALAAPVLLGDRLLGVVQVASRTAGRFTDEHVALLRLAADRMGLVLEQRRLYHAERDARTTAQAESRAKTEWIAMLSHEVRSPLAAIRSAAAALEGLVADPGVERLRGVIARQVHHLTRLTEDLLDVSRLESGRLALDRRPIDLEQVVGRALTSLREAGKLEGRRLEIHLASAWVDGDPMRLEQVAGNLVDNALKHTAPDRRIVVATEARDGEAVLRVQDEGSGIPPEFLPRIFDAFVQGPPALSGARGGLGLGLTLVRRLVELHGGSIEAASAGVGCGATFVARFPRRPAPTGPVEARSAPPPPERGVRVLLVEDSADARVALRALLERWGHEVEEAADGASGLAAARRFRPHAVIVDLGLPGMDGLELAEAIRATAQGATTLLIALTGHGRADDRRRAQSARFDAFLVKPADPEELRQILAKAPGRGAPMARGSAP